MAGVGQAVQFDWLVDVCSSEPVPADQQWVLGAMTRHGQELVSLLWRILGNEQDVCDAYQTAFLHLARLPESRRPRRLRAYVFRTAANVAISTLRSRAAEQRRRDAWCAPSGPRPPIHELDQRELVSRLRHHLGRLPEHLREVVVLRDLVELPYRRVAKTLGITPGTARVYRCKAVQLLAQWMTEDEER